MSHPIDALAHTNRLRSLPPQHKLGFASLLLLLSLIGPPAVQLTIAAWVGLWVMGYAAIPARLYLPLLLLPLGFALISLPALVLNGLAPASSDAVQADIWRGLTWPLVGGTELYVSRLGLAQAGALLSRSLAATSCLLLALLTTPFSELIGVLRQLRVPELFLELMLFTYGFIFTLLAIAAELWIAQQARGGRRNWRAVLRDLALLVGQLLHRAMASYRALAMGLAARGFSGSLRVVSTATHQPSGRYGLEAIAGCTALGTLTLIGWR